MINKIFGYTLLAIGLVMIIFSVWYSYNIFYGKSLPPSIFAEPIISQNNKNLLNSFSLQAVSQEQIEQLISQQFSQVISAKDVIKILNLIGWSAFAVILIFASGMISLIGVKLINGSRVKQ